MTAKEDVQFLALLVHRGELERAAAESLLPRMKEGRALDLLLVDELGWTPARVEKLRRTRGGEIPEIPGFVVLGKLGAGGTADVFRVREVRENRILALKVLKAASARNPLTLKAFVAEARLLERLEHPSLVKGYGVGRSGTTYFSKLELVDGSTLIELIDQGYLFDESAALRMVLDVAGVLALLAAEGVIHRDIKPGNIMLGSAGAVKLIDLGFAAGEDSAPNPEDSAVGTVAYLSPEAAVGGAAADMRSDIYSLGVTLFQLVVGRLPFESSDDREVLRMQIMDSLSSPELKGRNLSPHLHYFVQKMMAKDRAVRYQSWAELIDDIQAQLAGRDSLDFQRDASSDDPRRPGKRRRR